jgi:hypothetical protein
MPQRTWMSSASGESSSEAMSCQWRTKKMKCCVPPPRARMSMNRMNPHQGESALHLERGREVRRPLIAHRLNVSEVMMIHVCVDLPATSVISGVRLTGNRASCSDDSHGRDAETPPTLAGQSWPGILCLTWVGELTRRQPSETGRNHRSRRRLSRRSEGAAPRRKGDRRTYAPRSARTHAGTQAMTPLELIQ